MIDWENVIDWEVVDNLSDEQIITLLRMFDKE